jgi:glutamyl-tRNA reductase
MNLYVCGLSHKTAPVVVREEMSLCLSRTPEPLLLLREQTCVQGAVLLSTCNRTEFYCATDQALDVVPWWLNLFQACVPRFAPYLYCYQDNDAVEHALKVASGLDSLVLGEPQIFGQLKQSVANAREHGTIGSQLNHLFDYVFSVCKQVRTSTLLGEKPISVASVSVMLAKQIFADLSALNVLFIGVSEINRLAVKHFCEQGVHQVTIANRTLHKAQELAVECGGKAIALEHWTDALRHADLVVTSTSATQPILTQALVQQALVRQKRRPILIIDLAVPRDVEPAVGDLPDVYLYGIDDLQTVVNEHLGHREQAALQAQHLIKKYSSQYINKLQERSAFATIRSFRNKAEEVRDMELERAIAELKNGKVPEEVLTQLSHRLTSKLLHQPTLSMRQAGYDGDGEKLTFVRKLFGLEEK